MQKNKLFIKYEQTLNCPELAVVIVTQLLNWIGHPDQSLIDNYFYKKLERFNSNQFKQFLNHNSIDSLHAFENPVTKEISLLAKLVLSEDYEVASEYITSNLDSFLTIKNNPSLLVLENKKAFLSKMREQYSVGLKYDNLLTITKIEESKLYGLTSIQNAFSIFDLPASFLFELQNSHDKNFKEKAKKIFLKKLKTTFSVEDNLSIELIEEFIQNNSMEIYEFLGFIGNKKNLLKHLNLSMEKIDSIKVAQEQKILFLKQKLEEEKEAIRLEKEKQFEERVWKKTLVHINEAPVYLGVKPSQFKKWTKDLRIPIADTVSFKKRGVQYYAHKYDPKVLKSITPEMIAQWTELDHQQKVKKTKIVLQSSKDKAQWTRHWNKQKKDLDALGFVFDKGNISKKYHLTFKLEGDIFKNNLWFSIPFAEAVKEKENGLIEFTENSFSLFSEEVLSLQLKEKIIFLSKKYLGELHDIQEKIFIHESLILFIHQNSSLNLLLNEILEKHFQILIHELEVLRTQKEVRQVLDLDDYANNFPIARNLNRDIKIIVGPTNSGKTFEALETLKKAKSGIYLAPLRLLAMEVFDKLNLAGIPCNLFTGEEHIHTPYAQHTACTIEMMDSNNIVDVAVIDEFQMLKDTGRGSAWTAALAGVPAKKVFAVGSTESLEMITQLFKYLKEDFSVVELTRKTPLVLLKDPVTIYEVQKQDIVVAFTRKNVLTIAAQLRKRGLSVSVIYGSLSPEVRKKQSELFLNGTHDVVVATDAIGMGLNLPAKRVIFSTISKFDGIEKRKLLLGEIKQIAGRAGRFGLFEEGQYSTFSRTDLNYLNKIKDEKMNESFERMQIAPSLKHILDLQKHLKFKDNKIHSLIYYFSQKIGIQNPLFKNASLDSMLALSVIVDLLAPDMSIQDKFVLVCAPVSINKEDDINYYKKTVLAIKENSEMPLFVFPQWIYEENSQNLQEAENLSKNLSIYSWLSYRYKHIFFERDLIPIYRSKISQYIADRLVKEQSPYIW